VKLSVASSQFYLNFIPINGYMVSGVRIQLTSASVLTPDTFSKSEQNEIKIQV